jgi:Flp pilus assembly secretin CpaC
MAFGSRVRMVTSRSLPALAFALGMVVLGIPSRAPAADINVILDQAQLVRLPDRIATIVIGNPSIADVAIQSGGNTMVITGKGYGVTNIIALDRSGAVMIDKTIEVRGPRTDVIVVYRGVERESYSCTPACERRVTLGDGAAHFDAATGQTIARNGLAQGAAAAATQGGK